MIKLTLEDYVAELNEVGDAPMCFCLVEPDYALALHTYAGPSEYPTDLYIVDRTNATKLIYCLLILEAEGR